MDIIKIIAIGLVGVATSVLLRRNNSEFAMLISVGAGCVILFLVLPSVTAILKALDNLTERTGIDNALFTTLIKVVGVGYLTEFGASIAEDAKESGIASKIKFAGKIAIFLVALPIFNTIIDYIAELLG